MNRTRKKRLQEVAQQIDAMPIAPAVEKAAFERFRETGELPEHQRLAEVVIQRALRGGEARGVPQPLDLETALRRLNEAAAGLEASTPRRESVRKLLFYEAVHGSGIVKLAARMVLEALVFIGGDVTAPEFLDEDMELPDFGSVGLHLLGFPEFLVMPPYEEQARRLFDRFADIRDRINHDRREWFAEFDRAVRRFFKQGEVPNDELMQEAVLANGEYVGLLGHAAGQGNPEAMALYNEVATTAGADRDVAIKKLQAMAAEGRLVSRDAFE